MGRQQLPSIRGGHIAIGSVAGTSGTAQPNRYAGKSTATGGEPTTKTWQASVYVDALKRITHGYFIYPNITYELDAVLSMTRRELLAPHGSWWKGSQCHGHFAIEMIVCDIGTGVMDKSIIHYQIFYTGH